MRRQSDFANANDGRSSPLCVDDYKPPHISADGFVLLDLRFPRLAARDLAALTRGGTMPPLPLEGGK